MKELLLMINSISRGSSQDELDVLAQAEAVERAAEELGYAVRRAYFDLDLGKISELLTGDGPDLVFNLVESVAGKGALIHLCPSLLDAFAVPYTGSGTYALVASTNKLITKQILKSHGIPTPDWIRQGSGHLPGAGKKYILKPIWEDGSVRITDESVLEGTDIDLDRMTADGQLKDAFLEEYIDGREFNLSLLSGMQVPEVMPVAEMLYVDYPAGKPRILNYASKWDDSSFEYHRTIRTFSLPEADWELAETMSEISRQCWRIFDMKGYIRVDFRVDEQNRPWVLEVNANPCLAPDAGFVAACQEAGIEYTKMINRIIAAVK